MSFINDFEKELEIAFSMQNRTRVFEIREQIKSAFKDAYNDYLTYAKGYDHLAPVTKHGIDQFGLSFSLYDSLDTLLLMNLTKEFEITTDYIMKQTKYNENLNKSVFELTIRNIGALITTFEQTNDYRFLNKAEEFAKMIINSKIFDTNLQYPKALFNLQENKSYDHDWNLYSTVLSDLGSLQMEFFSLTHHTGKMIYWEKVDYIKYLVQQYVVPPCSIHHGNAFHNYRVFYTFDALGDSYFEYLLKMYLLAPLNSSYCPIAFYRAIKRATKQFLKTSRNGNYEFLDTIQNSKFTNKMTHLSYFLPGTLFLAEKTFPNSKLFADLGDRLMKTATGMHKRVMTGLSADEMLFTPSDLQLVDDSYKLRPEYVESLFYLWRVRHTYTARKLAFEYFQNLQRYAKVGNAFTTISKVNSEIPSQEDIMDSFFLSETLKYLYLTFSDDNEISLDDYVFTTQAHYLKKKNCLHID